MHLMLYICLACQMWQARQIYDTKCIVVSSPKHLCRQKNSTTMLQMHRFLA